MYKLVIPIVISLLLYLGYKLYDQNQQQIQQEIDARNYNLEKEAFEKAKASRSLSSLNQFIAQNPDSIWQETAIYYRDKLEVQQIIQSRDTQKLKDFISQHPNSEWSASARQTLMKIQREQENKEIQQRVLSRQPVVDLSARKSLNLDNTENESQYAKKSQQSSSDRKSRVNDSRERVKRALSIYQKMGKQQIRKDQERKQRQQQEAKQARACIELKDQLSQFNRRTRWYKLDDSGKRVFMSKQAVAQKKKEIRNTIKENCS